MARSRLRASVLPDLAALAIRTAVVSTTMLAALGCADTDPSYGPPGAIHGWNIDYRLDAAATPPSPPQGTDGSAPKTARQTFGELYDSIKTSCAPCHAPGGLGGVFFLATGADAAYPIFKQNRYFDTTVPQPKGFITKGLHSGPALTPAEKALTETWAKAEAAEEAAPAQAPRDAGGG